MPKIVTAFVLTSLSLALPNALSQGAPARKIFSPQERQAEEVRIRKDVEEKLDWHNRAKETLDEIGDAHRMLYGKLNESILLRQATGERFGIFESFDEKTNTKRFEIRLHKKNKLTDRFLSGSVFCDSPAISADKVAEKFVLYREICYRNNQPNHTLYLYDYLSDSLYWLYTNEVNYSERPTVSYERGLYKVRWNVQIIGSGTKVAFVRNFKILKGASGTWEAKSMPPINNELDDVTIEPKLPLKPEFDLPAFVADWGK
jgi:hypothetical protein